MKAPLKITMTLEDGDGKVISTSTFENLKQADVVEVQQAVAGGLLSLGQKKLAEKTGTQAQPHKG